MKKSKSFKSAEPEKSAYTFEQAEHFIRFSKGHKYGIEVALLLICGLRKSELLALRWENIDFQNEFLCVRQSVSVANSGIEINNCKSKKSIRDIPLTSFAIKGLQQLRLREYSNGENDFVVTSSLSNGVMSPTNWSDRRFSSFTKSFSEYLKANSLDIPLLKPHELRHSFGSILYSQGIDIVTISRLMGHESIEVNAGIYVHKDANKEKMAINKLEFAE